MINDIGATQAVRESIGALRERFNNMVKDHDGSFRANGVGSSEPDENAKLYDAITDDILACIPEPISSKSVLEVGCGTGEIMLRMKPRVTSVQGVDVSDRMVEMCRQHGLDANVVTDKLPFPDRSFDAVLLYSVLINIDSADLLDRMLAEAFRVTKQGGVVILGSVPNADHLKFLVHQPRTTMDNVRRFAKRLLGRRDRGARQVQYFAYKPAQFVGYCDRFAASKFVLKRSLLSDAGLQKIDVIYYL